MVCICTTFGDGCSSGNSYFSLCVCSSFYYVVFFAVARVEERTIIACAKEVDAGITNHWREPKQMEKDLRALFKGSMRGRTMYKIAFFQSIVVCLIHKLCFGFFQVRYSVLHGSVEL